MGEVLSPHLAHFRFFFKFIARWNYSKLIVLFSFLNSKYIST